MRLKKLLLFLILTSWVMLSFSYSGSIKNNTETPLPPETTVIVKRVQAADCYSDYHRFAGGAERERVLAYLQADASTVTELEYSPHMEAPRGVVGSIIVEEFVGARMRVSIVFPDDRVVWGDNIWQGKAKGAYAGLDAMIRGRAADTDKTRVMEWNATARADADGYIPCTYSTDENVVNAVLSYIAHLVPLSGRPEEPLPSGGGGILEIVCGTQSEEYSLGHGYVTDSRGSWYCERPWDAERVADAKGYVPDEDNVSLGYGPMEGTAPLGRYFTDKERMEAISALLKPEEMLPAPPKTGKEPPICATVWESGEKRYFSVYPRDVMADVTDESNTLWYAAQPGTFQGLYTHLTA